MYPPHHQGGYEVVWRSFVEHARAAGHDVRVLASDHREAGVAAGDPPWVARDLRWWWADHAFPPRTLPERVRIVRRARTVLAAALRDVRPDAVMWWAMGGMPLALVALAARAGVPAVGVVHDPWPAYGPEVDRWIGTRAGRALAPVVGVPAAFDPADVAAWSCNSAHVRDIALRQPGWAGLAGRVQVDHPGIDPDRFAAVAAPEGFGWRLAAVGRLDPRKGLEHAVAALPALPQATLTVHGGGDAAHAADLERRARELGVADRLVLAGPTTDPAGAYAAADAVLFPVTWDEPYGLVPLEAMAVGRPVVATATGGAAEFLADGRNALVVAPGDPGAIAAAVTRLAADGALRARLVAGGHATAAARTQAGCDAALLALVSRVAGRPARAGR
jgi:glycosyltransferase involved in cell wall biosynthesis